MKLFSIIHLSIITVLVAGQALASQPTVDDFVNSEALRAKYEKKCSDVDPFSLPEDSVCRAYHRAADKKFFSRGSSIDLSDVKSISSLRETNENTDGFDSSRRGVREDIASLVENLCNLSRIKYAYLNGQRVMPELYQAAQKGQGAYDKLKGSLTCESFDVELIEKNKKMWGG